jgi:hypothetical protein
MISPGLRDSVGPRGHFQGSVIAAAARRLSLPSLGRAQTDILIFGKFTIATSLNSPASCRTARPPLRGFSVFWGVVFLPERLIRNARRLLLAQKDAAPDLGRASIGCVQFRASRDARGQPLALSGVFEPR